MRINAGSHQRHRLALQHPLALQAGLIAAGSLTILALGVQQAEAYVVTVNNVQYDVTTFTGSYNANSSKFNTAANGGVMPWWGDGTLAGDFANAVQSALGGPNYFLANTWSPYFAYGLKNSGANGIRAAAYFMNAWQQGPVYDIGSQGDGPLLSDSGVWAQATLYTAPASVPAPLPIFGAGAAFGFSRRLRRRIQLARPQASTKTSA